MSLRIVDCRFPWLPMRRQEGVEETPEESRDLMADAVDHGVQAGPMVRSGDHAPEQSEARD